MMKCAACQICGSRQTIDERSPAVCPYFCYWLLEGWLGWNSRRGLVAIRNQHALRFVGASLTLSYPKLIATARMQGWTGQENVVGTFPPPAAKPPVMKAKGAAA